MSKTPKADEEMIIKENEAKAVENTDAAENAEVAVCMPNGCLKCGGSGYAGRIGVYEIMPITLNLKKVIAAGGDSEQIKEVALREGMATLRMSAAKLVLQGITSMSEMKRISFES